MTECDEIIIIMYIVSTKETNTIATKMTNIIAVNVMNTDPINCHSKKVRDCYILHAVLLVIILLLIAVSICCYLIKHQVKHLLAFQK